MTTPIEPPADTKTSLSIALASPLDIRSWSYGFIKTPRLFDVEHRRFHHDGLFSQRIFGPIRDFQCDCGKFSGAHQVGVVCDECSVQIRPRMVRSQRMAHIELPVPIVHPWFCGRHAAPIELLLGLSHQQLKRLVARKRFIQLGTPPPHLRSNLCSAVTAQGEGDRTLDGFLGRSGGDAVRRLLQRTDFAALLPLLEEYAHGGEHSASLQRRLAELQLDPRYAARLFRPSPHLRQRVELLREIVRSGTVPKDAVLEVLPVIPAGLRTAEMGPDGRIVVDAVTAHYQRILRCCGALQRCLDRIPVRQGAWPTGETKRQIVRRERRLATEIASLFDELLHRGSPASHPGPVRDRQRRCPGKRVDYSAHSVVVPDPSLPLYACRLPRKKVAEVMFEPTAEQRCDGSTIGSDALESEAMKHPLVLNFSPADQPSTLLSLRPRLTDDDATHVHPLVAATLDRSFADLDATIHLPLSLEAQADCDRLSFPAVHIRDATAGGCRLRLAADAAVGCYYASWFSDDRRKMLEKVVSGYPPPDAVVHRFASLTDVQVAWEERRAHVHDVMEIRLAPGQPLYRSVSELVDASEGKRRAWTTVGRALINALLPVDAPYFDVPFDESNLNAVVQQLIETHGAQAAERFVQQTCALGFHMLTRTGLSLSLADFDPPASFQKTLEGLNKDIARLTRLHERGIIGEMERQSQIADATRNAQDALAHKHLEAIFFATAKMHPLLAMFGAGGQAVRDSIKRIAGIVGMVWSPWKFHLSAPVLRSLRTGIDPPGYFKLAAIARRQHFCRTVPSSRPRQLQRRIATALADVVVTEEDCGASEGVVIDRGRDEATAAAFARLITGRVMTQSLHHFGRGTIVEASQMISPRAARDVEACGISAVQVRSPLTCRARHGVCRWCYGDDRAAGRLVDLGAAVGMKAALAIGPTLQAIDALWGRSEFDSNEYDVLRASVGGVVSLRRLRVVVDHRQLQVVVAPGGELEIFADDAVVRTQRVPHGAVVHVTSGSEVAPGAQLASWSASHFPVFAQDSGVVRIETGRSEQGGRFVTIVNPTGAVVDGFFLPRHGKLIVAEGARAEAGTCIAAYYRSSDYKLVPARDRLERLKLLFESRTRRDQALLAPIDARVELQANVRPDRVTVLLHPLQGGAPLQFHLPWDSPRYFVVRHGQTVQPGDPLTRGEVFLGDRIRTRGADDVRPLILGEIWTRLAELKKARPDDDRPWELLVAQMLRYVQIESTGDTAYGVGEIAPWCEVRSVNHALRKKVKVADRHAYPLPLETDVISRHLYELVEQRRRKANPTTPPPPVTAPWPAGWSPRLMGVEELARQRSFLTAGGFIPTREALVLACLSRSQRLLEGMQESVIAGRLMPAGSGWAQRANE